MPIISYELNQLLAVIPVSLAVNLFICAAAPYDQFKFICIAFFTMDIVTNMQRSGDQQTVQTRKNRI